MYPSVRMGARRVERGVAALAFLIAASPAYVRAEALTEDDVVRRAVEVARPSTPAEARAEAALAVGVSRSTWDNPTLGLDHESLFTPGLTGEAEGSAVVFQRIDLSGRRGLGARAAAHDASARRLEGAGFVAGFVADVRRQFFSALFWQRRRAVLRRFQARLVAARDNLALRAKAGDVARYDSLRLDQEVAIATAASSRADAEATAALSALRVFLGEGDGGDVALAGPLAPPAPPQWPAVVERLAAHPRLRALAAEEQAAADLERAADRWWAPPLSIGAGPRAGWSDKGAGAGYVVGFTVPLPVFDREQGARLEARARRAELGARARLLRLDLERSARSAHRLATELRASAGALREVASTDEALLAGADAAWTKGESRVLDLVDAYRLVAERELTALDLERDARLAAIELDHLLAVEPTP